MNYIVKFWPSLLLLALSAIPWCYCVLHDQGKLKGFGPDEGFFGFNQYRRKYKKPIQPAPDNFYYRFYKLKYKERFPGSAGPLSSLTDGYHLLQDVAKLMTFAAVAILTVSPWRSLAVIYLAFSFIFMVFYKILSR